MAPWMVKSIVFLLALAKWMLVFSGAKHLMTLQTEPFVLKKKAVGSRPVKNVVEFLTPMAFETGHYFRPSRMIAWISSKLFVQTESLVGTLSRHHSFLCSVKKLTRKFQRTNLM